MGNRKRLAAEKRKEERKSIATAQLNKTPTSPRKMRIVADTIRGEPVEKAVNLLKFSKKHAARKLEKLLQSAVFNWQLKNEGQRVEDSDLYVKTIFVDAGVTLKRFQPAPQGRAYRIRKRSNHVTIEIGSRILSNEKAIEEKTEAAEGKAKTTEKATKTKAAKPKADKPKTAKAGSSEKAAKAEKKEKPAQEKKDKNTEKKK